MRYVHLVLLLVFLGAIGVFAAQNTQVVNVRFLDRGMAAPFALVAACVYLLGMLSGWSVVGFLRRSIHEVSQEPRGR